MTRGSRNSVVTVVGLVLALLPAVASAQGVSEDRVAGAIGKDVTVTSADGKRIRGKLRTLSTTEIVLQQVTGQQGTGQQTTREFKLPLSNVKQIQRDSHAVALGAGIGLAAGVGLAVLELATGDTSDLPTAGAVGIVAVFGGIGAGAGAGIGAAFRPSGASRIVYQAPAKTSVTLSPVIGKGKVGVSGAIRW
jgi:hypothetical protein